MEVGDLDLDMQPRAPAAPPRRVRRTSICRCPAPPWPWRATSRPRAMRQRTIAVVGLQLVLGRGEREQPQPQPEEHDRALGLGVAHADEAQRHSSSGTASRCAPGARGCIGDHSSRSAASGRRQVGGLHRAHRARARVFGGAVLEVGDRGVSASRRAGYAVATGGRRAPIARSLIVHDILRLLICNVRERRRRSNQRGAERLTRAARAAHALSETLWEALHEELADPAQPARRRAVRAAGRRIGDGGAACPGGIPAPRAPCPRPCCPVEPDPPAARANARGAASAAGARPRPREPSSPGL